MPTPCNASVRNSCALASLFLARHRFSRSGTATHDIVSYHCRFQEGVTVSLFEHRSAHICRDSRSFSINMRATVCKDWLQEGNGQFMSQDDKRRIHSAANPGAKGVAMQRPFVRSRRLSLLTDATSRVVGPSWFSCLLWLQGFYPLTFLGNRFTMKLVILTPHAEI